MNKTAEILTTWTGTGKGTEDAFRPVLPAGVDRWVDPTGATHTDGETASIRATLAEEQLAAVILEVGLSAIVAIGDL